MDNYRAFPNMTAQKTLPISVVVTTFDDHEYLAQCLESVCAQYAQPAELIVVDDGSPGDGARNVAMLFERRVRRFKFIKKINGGPSSARNAGLREAGQSYITFIDADDKMLPSNLSVKFKEIVKLDAGYCSIYGNYVDGRTKKIVIHKNCDEIPPTSWVGKGNGVAGSLFCHLFKTHVLVEVGGLDINIRRNEDFDLLIRLARLGYRFKGAIGTGVVRNYRPGSLTRSSRLYDNFNNVSIFLDKAERLGFFEASELAARRKQNNLSLAKRLWRSGCPRRDVMAVLSKAFMYEAPSRPKEWLAYMLTKVSV